MRRRAKVSNPIFTMVNIVVEMGMNRLHPDSQVKPSYECDGAIDSMDYGHSHWRGHHHVIKRAQAS